MLDSIRVVQGLKNLSSTIKKVTEDYDGLDDLDIIIDTMRECLRNGGTLFFIGNGGSAADAQHIAAEYVVRYKDNTQKALRAIALTTDSSILTAGANDMGFPFIFSRQLEALGHINDVLIVHSTSGNSQNCILAVRKAHELGMLAIGFLGYSGGILKQFVDYQFRVPSIEASHIQEIHLAVQHQIAEILTQEYSS